VVDDGVGYGIGFTFVGVVGLSNCQFGLEKRLRFMLHRVVTRFGKKWLLFSLLIRLYLPMPAIAVGAEENGFHYLDS
jgi:hypothetical protein